MKKRKINRYRLVKQSTDIDSIHVTNSSDVFHLFNKLDLDKDIQENFVVFHLNVRNYVIDWSLIGIGNMNACLVDISLISLYCVKSRCKNVILAHNHPSGLSNPSESDKKVTQNIKGALSLFEINVLDHIIVGNNNYFSFADEKLI